MNCGPGNPERGKRMSMALIPAPLRELASGAQWVAVPGPRHAHLAIRQERVLDVHVLHVLDEQGPAALDQSRLAHLNEVGGVSRETEIGAAYCDQQRVAARHCGRQRCSSRSPAPGGNHRAWPTQAIASAGKPIPQGRRRSLTPAYPLAGRRRRRESCACLCARRCGRCAPGSPARLPAGQRWAICRLGCRCRRS